MKDIKNFLPEYRKINTIFSKALKTGTLSYSDQCVVTDFFRSHDDVEEFERMILDLIIHTEASKMDLLIRQIHSEVEKNIQLYESGKKGLDAIDVKAICKEVFSRYDSGIKDQSEITAEYRRELNKVNGSLEAIGFRDHTPEEERRLWLEHERLKEEYDRERKKLSDFYDLKEKLRMETARYAQNVFPAIYELSQSFHSVLQNYRIVPSADQKPDSVEVKPQTPPLDIHPDQIFRSKMYDKFRELETRLIKDRYLDENLHWLPKHRNDKPDIKTLVTFLTALMENDYFLP